jgi:hypothetical protein
MNFLKYSIQNFSWFSWKVFFCLSDYKARIATNWDGEAHRWHGLGQEVRSLDQY